MHKHDARRCPVYNVISLFRVQNANLCHLQAKHATIM